MLESSIISKFKWQILIQHSVYGIALLQSEAANHLSDVIVQTGYTEINSLLDNSLLLVLLHSLIDFNLFPKREFFPTGQQVQLQRVLQVQFVLLCQLIKLLQNLLVGRVELQYALSALVSIVKVLFLATHRNW